MIWAKGGKEIIDLQVPVPPSKQQTREWEKFTKVIGVLLDHHLTQPNTKDEQRAWLNSPSRILLNKLPRTKLTVKADNEKMGKHKER